MDRIDIYPIKTYKGYKLGIGRPLLFGATIVSGGVNFSIYSMHAQQCVLVLFEKDDVNPLVEIPFTEEFRMGNVFSMVVFGIDFETTEYAYRFDDPGDSVKGLCYDKTKLLIDPYAKALAGMEKWGIREKKPLAPYRSKIIADDYDWEGDKPLSISKTDLVIYECHVRGYTKDPSSKVKYPGTFMGLREKIPYIKELGINCVELMPIYEFDEMEGGSRVLNYWGYDPVGFFAPKAGYSVLGNMGQQVDEFKSLIKHMHRNGIEVILDVVFNHTAEGNENGPIISFKGIDNSDYYILSPDGKYMNYSGCGNTLNCNNPVVRNMILDCLRYWAVEYHIDGFRFDLASIMSRSEDGTPMMNPPLLESLAYDPILSHCMLIAEAWDAGGLYQVGSFPVTGHFSEWNGRYRDAIRLFLKGDDNKTGEAVTRILGSSDIYTGNNRNAASSVNYITCHDGFTMRDLFSYNSKHNEANNEENRDGTNENLSWNCGCEGETDDAAIISLRKKQIKNAFSILLISQGIPMILAGDEFGNTQSGNNNVYCQDNTISWLDWKLVSQNKEILNYVKDLIAFRREHPVLRRAAHFDGKDPDSCGVPDVSMYSYDASAPDYGKHTIEILYGGHYAGKKADDDILVLINMYWKQCEFTLPKTNHGTWFEVLNSAKKIRKADFEKRPIRDEKICLEARSVVIIIGRH